MSRSGAYGDAVVQLTRASVLAFRMRAQQLDRERGAVHDTAVLDAGVQDTGPDTARWALALRGLPDPPQDRLATVWTLRGAPHVHRRDDLPGLAAATEPFSEADAGKRILNAARPLADAGISAVQALDHLAAALRAIVTGPMVKGEVSARLTALLPPPYLKQCEPCGATHPYELTFRLAALRAGLELQPGTSPPVLQPIPGFSRAEQVPDHLDPVRAHLRLLGPATPHDVAAHLDAPVRDVGARWPEDVVEVQVEGKRRWLLAGDEQRCDAPPPAGVRLLPPHDPFLQARDRALLVPQPARARQLWRAIGSPGAVLVDGEVVGTWRPRKAGRALVVSVQLWDGHGDARDLQDALQEQAERLAAVRGAPRAQVVDGT